LTRRFAAEKKKKPESFVATSSKNTITRLKDTLSLGNQISDADIGSNLMSHFRDGKKKQGLVVTLRWRAQKLK